MVRYMAGEDVEDFGFEVGRVREISRSVLLGSLHPNSINDRTVTESLNLDTRNAKPIPGEGYSITWYKDDVELYDFTDSTHVEVDDEVEEGGVGVYTIEVKLFTREVRKDPMGLMRSKGDFYVGERCRGR